MSCVWLQVVSEEQTELRGALMSGPASNICSSSLLKLHRVQEEAFEVSVPGNSLLPRSDILPLSSR